MSGNVVEPPERVGPSTGRRIRRVLSTPVGAVGQFRDALVRIHSASDGGRSLALITFMSVFAITLTLIVIDNIDMSDDVKPLPAMIVVMILMIIAVLTMLLLLCTIRSDPPPAKQLTTGGGGDQSWKIHIRKQLVLFGMVPFYFISVSLLIHRVIGDVACWQAWSYDGLAMMSNSTSSSPGGRDVDRQMIAHLVYVHRTRPVFNSILCVFMGLEMILCCQFHTHSFRQNHMTLLVLAIVQVTNVSVWLDMVLDESYIGVAKKHAEHRKVERIILGGHGNSSSTGRNRTAAGLDYDDYTIGCLTENRVEHHLFETSSKLLYPFAVEYLFLATECVAHWFFNCETDDTNQGRKKIEKDDELKQAEDGEAETSGTTTTSDDIVRASDETGSRCSKSSSSTKYPNAAFVNGSVGHHRNSEPCADEDRMLQPFGADDCSTPAAAAEAEMSQMLPSDELRRPDGSDANGESKRRIAFPFYFVWTTLVGITNVLYINSGVVYYSFDDGYKTAVVGYRIAYLSFILLCIVVCLVYVVCGYGKTTNQIVSGFEYLIVISMLGPICQVVFSTVTGSSSVACQDMLNVTEIIAQTVFYFKSSRLAPIVGRQHRTRKRVFQAVLFLLLISNGAMWIDSGLTETLNLDQSFQKRYYNEVWLYIYAVTNPIQLIFRFNSFILFTNVYLENT